ncbi:hypothetical protein KIPB_004830, partial [Kipferlia bialata]|eukprot:g4830.t1
MDGGGSPPGIPGIPSIASCIRADRRGMVPSGVRADGGRVLPVLKQRLIREKERGMRAAMVATHPSATPTRRHRIHTPDSQWHPMLRHRRRQRLSQYDVSPGVDSPSFVIPESEDQVMIDGSSSDSSFHSFAVSPSSSTSSSSSFDVSAMHMGGGGDMYMGGGGGGGESADELGEGYGDGRRDEPTDSETETESEREREAEVEISALLMQSLVSPGTNTLSPIRGQPERERGASPVSIRGTVALSPSAPLTLSASAPVRDAVLYARERALAQTESRGRERALAQTVHVTSTREREREREAVSPTRDRGGVVEREASSPDDSTDGERDRERDIPLATVTTPSVHVTPTRERERHTPSRQREMDTPTRERERERHGPSRERVSVTPQSRRSPRKGSKTPERGRDGTTHLRTPSLSTPVPPRSGSGRAHDGVSSGGSRRARTPGSGRVRTPQGSGRVRTPQSHVRHQSPSSIAPRGGVAGGSQSPASLRRPPSPALALWHDDALACHSYLAEAGTGLRAVCIDFESNGDASLVYIPDYDSTDRAKSCPMADQLLFDADQCLAPFYDTDLGECAAMRFIPCPTSKRCFYPEKPMYREPLTRTEPEARNDIDAPFPDTFEVLLTVTGYGNTDEQLLPLEVAKATSIDFIDMLNFTSDPKDKISANYWSDALIAENPDPADLTDVPGPVK